MKQYMIQNGDIQAVILPGKGATLTRLIKNGVDFLYTDEENLTSPERPRCGVPFLFPIFGRLQNETYTWDGNTYHMGIHGFAHTSSWEVAEHADTQLKLALKSSEATRRVYPFDFEVVMTFQLLDDRLDILLRIENTGSVPMPYNYGFHPYFLADQLEKVEVEAQAGVRIDFSSGKALPFGHDVITLTIPEGAPEAGAALAQLGSPTVIHIPEEGRKLTMDHDDSFTQLILWTQAGKQFLCVEPINGSPNGLNTGSYMTLNPGEIRNARLSLRPECI